MAERRIRYTVEATRDLEAIWLYGAEVWGTNQATDYANALRASIETLREMPEIGRKRAEFTPPLCIHPSARHLIIYFADDSALTVVRILSPRQNWQAILGPQ